ncbi:alpha/beta hydrolase [Tundrisphaera lichenicola]|uniref:alpha/beta hydrolase n=1 Tax=Tundrisphaera lichenicola TaxID=2029860 RepID=UPI003EBCE2ED
MAFSAVALITLATTQTPGNDFGDLFKRAAKDVIRKSVAPVVGDVPENRPRNRARPGAPIQNPIANLLAPTTQSTAPEPYPVQTADGWTLVATRYRPTVAPRPGASPIILCHGLTYNAMFWNLDPSCSPATALAGMGFDVWAVDLRGSGQSMKWVWKLDDAPTMLFGEALRRVSNGKLAPTGYATVDPKAANWTMDQHIVHDVPALVRLVRQQTGAADVTWFGHSMGGIVALAHLARYQNPGIGRVVAIGSQLTMPQGQVMMEFATEMLATREGQLAGQITGRQIAEQSKTSVDNLFFNRSNALPAVYDALSGWAKDVPSVGLLKQYMAMAQQGELISTGGAFNYTRNAQNITVPILLGCGAVDSFAPPTVQQYLYNHVGSTDKSLMIIGRQSGFSADAGHDDALVGLNSKAEVYPRIARWIVGIRELPQPAKAAF